VLVVAMITLLTLLTACLVTPSAFADTGTTAGTGSGSDQGQGQTAAGVSIAITSATAVVTASSGYHLKTTLKNSTSHALPEGTVALSTNIFYGFVSRTDIQQWAQGEAPIPTPDQLGQAHVAALNPGASAAVSIDVPANQDRLKAMVNWGPKPLLLSYSSTDGTKAQTTSFLTRSQDGLNTADTPAMGLTVTMPLTGDSWQLDDNAAGTLLTGTGDAAAKVTPNDAVTLRNGTRLPHDTEQLLAQHPMLQAVADPAYLKALSLPPRSVGIMQPGYFDITGYAAKGNPQAYADAGVDTDAWNASTATVQLRDALGDQSASQPAYAWQGSGQWSVQALDQAKRQGFSTVIASSGFDDQDAATVHTGKYIVPTGDGDVTVLSAQRELSSLANGHMSNANANGESSPAGRIARFMAQSAFYQMEQPYTARNLLVCLSANASAADANALMGAIEQAPWLGLTSLDALSASEPYASGSDAASLAPSDSGIAQQGMKALDDTLRTLRSTRGDISHFAASILASATPQPTASGSPSASDAGSPQALAQQNANTSGKQDSTGWISQVMAVHDRLALRALSGNAPVRERMTAGARDLASKLMGGVAITPTERVTVVSETASMPVTVSNNHPYPVRVRISSLTDSMEIVTTRFSDVDVPAHGSTQTTFTIRVSTTGSATARLTLLDRDGKQFSAPKYTPIISTLQISDTSGFIFVAVAVALGLLGLWRQFHRKKDPDE
jgi:hypothetical protein